MEKVAQLCSSKQRLSKSLQDVRVSIHGCCMDGGSLNRVGRVVQMLGTRCPGSPPAPWPACS